MPGLHKVPTGVHGLIVPQTLILTSDSSLGGTEFKWNEFGRLAGLGSAYRSLLPQPTGPALEVAVTNA